MLITINGQSQHIKSEKRLAFAPDVGKERQLLDMLHAQYADAGIAKRREFALELLIEEST